MEHKTTEDQEAVAKLLISYQELITALKSKLKHCEEVIKKKDAYIVQLGQKLTSNTNHLSSIATSAISHNQQQYKLDLNNKDKLLMRLINLHTSRGSFHDFITLSKTIDQQCKRKGVLNLWKQC
jgi:hypothetical protein